MIKKTEEIFFRIMMIISTVAIAAALLLIIFSILFNGLPALSWDMITQTPKGGFYFGKEGGILNAVIGSLYLSVCSSIIAFIIGLPVAMYMNVFMKKYKRTLNSVRFILDILWGIPSIVYGAFGFVIMIYFGLKTSLLAGIITISLFILPIMVRSMDEVLKTVPSGLHESALSLGSTRSEISFKIFFRQCIPGIVTAVLLSFGRAIGDAASVLFTTGYTDSIPESLSDPAATLPLAIFFQLSSPVEEVRQRAFASAAVLTFIILLISIVARLLSTRYNRNKIKF